MDVVKFINDKWTWSRKTFGDGLRSVGISDHIRKELKEIEADRLDVVEWIDVILLGLDGASRAVASQPVKYGDRDVGVVIWELLCAKQLVNYTRHWPAEPTPEHLPVEHVRMELVDDPQSSTGERLAVSQGIQKVEGHIL